MRLEYDARELAFRDEVRAFLADKLPDDIRARQRGGNPMYSHLEKQDYVRWVRILNERGWAAPAWPQEYGGPGWDVVQRNIFEEECDLDGAPPMLPFGISMVGPVIMEYGSQAQKDYFLPRILNMDDFWCQGYSEPGSGSDLASLSTRAERDGDQYVVNGQKIWTTLAHWADWMFCLVRTSNEARKQQGISFLLLRMDTPGIEVRPIMTIDGTHELNEVFFDDVRVPVANRVGEEGKGWTIAKFLLGNERTTQARIGRTKRQLQVLKEMARESRSASGATLADDAGFGARLAAAEIELMALEVTTLRTVSEVQGGGVVGNKPSVLKVRGTEVQQRLSELLVEAAGPCGPPTAGPEPEPEPDHAAAAVSHYLMRRAASIYGGSNEIQRNIIAKAMLGL